MAMGKRKRDWQTGMWVSATDLPTAASQRRKGLCLTLEARDPFRSSGERLGEDLDRHRAIEPSIARAVDFAHATSAERRENLVRADMCARR